MAYGLQVDNKILTKNNTFKIKRQIVNNSTGLQGEALIDLQALRKVMFIEDNKIKGYFYKTELTNTQSTPYGVMVDGIYLNQTLRIKERKRISNSDWRIVGKSNEIILIKPINNVNKIIPTQNGGIVPTEVYSKGTDTYFSTISLIDEFVDGNNDGITCKVQGTIEVVILTYSGTDNSKYGATYNNNSFGTTNISISSKSVLLQTKQLPIYNTAREVYLCSIEKNTDEFFTMGDLLWLFSYDAFLEPIKLTNTQAIRFATRAASTTKYRPTAAIKFPTVRLL